jgi:hypothetical protein
MPWDARLPWSRRNRRCASWTARRKSPVIAAPTIGTNWCSIPLTSKRCWRNTYGAAELRSAIREALERNTPRASSVAFILSRRQRSQQSSVPTPVDLSRHPELQSLDVTPHNLETYDELTHKHDDADK